MTLPNFKALNPSSWTFTRFTNGDSFLSVGKLGANYSAMEYLQATLDNYALFICLHITAEVCGKAKFEVVNENGDKVPNDPLLRLIENPNYLQTSVDFVKQWVWYKLANGKTPIWPILAAGHNVAPENVLAMYNLNYNQLQFPDDFTTPMLFLESDINEFKKTPLKYIEGEKKTAIELGELLFFYDVAAGLGKNMIDSPSRIQALRKNVHNINIGLDAENVMLQTNGREMFSGGADKGSHSGMQMPMDGGDKSEILTKLLSRYGMKRDQIRSIVTKNQINWQSLHIALKELGLWESATKNGTIIRNAFDIPETIFKLYMEGGDTFENKKEGQVQLIQDVGQNQMNDFCRSITSHFGYEKQRKKLIARFDHLEAMQFIEERKADRLLKVSTSIRNLTQANITGEQLQQILNDSNINVEL